MRAVAVTSTMAPAGSEASSVVMTAVYGGSGGAVVTTVPLFS